MLAIGYFPLSKRYWFSSEVLSVGSASLPELSHLKRRNLWTSTIRTCIDAATFLSCTVHTIATLQNST